MPAATTELERFARETLGCGCAPEVFRDVTEDSAALPGLAAPVRRIAIGGRLLIYLIPIDPRPADLIQPDLIQTPDIDAAAASLSAWAATARAERERLGMNRVRLVLGLTETAPGATAALEAAFAACPARDERLHLHLLPATALEIGPATRAADPEPVTPSPDPNPDSNATPTKGAQGYRRLRDWALNLALILAVFLGVQWWQSRPLASGAAPPLAGLRLDGTPVDLAELRGRPVLVHFWATWCPICKLSIGGVESIAKDHPVLTVAMQSGEATDIRAYLAEHGLELPVLIDEDGRLAARWGVRGVPANFVLNAAGQISYAVQGASTETGLRARLWAAGLEGDPH